MRFEARPRSLIGMLVIETLALSCGQDPWLRTSVRPRAVTDLLVHSVGVNSLFLRWTAPGDDGGTDHRLPLPVVR